MWDVVQPQVVHVSESDNMHHFLCQTRGRARIDVSDSIGSVHKLLHSPTGNRRTLLYIGL